MPPNTPQMEAAFALIVRDFNLPASSDGLTMEAVHGYLCARIGQLMAHNMGQLMSILYRIDVAEHRVKTILQFSPHAEIPAQLADLIIERQLQKIRTRQAHARHGP